ncbi:restriction endonuclease [Sorangium sp. So ce375]|uniref:restriction endonuclease n=1 Tax=Sorangium sp. So ce375 TaxID=3133306 RepID=UPI003F5C8ADE
MTLPPLHHLAESPDRLDLLPSRDFEIVIAEILAGFGWNVDLTPPTRDGGYDILGLTSDGSCLQTSWIVECKRYRADRTIGIEIIRSIYGVKVALGVSNAVVVTTSSFSPDAKSFAQERNAVQLVDRERLFSWLHHYCPRGDSSAHIDDRRFYSCFVSHSSADRIFARRLAQALQSNGIHTWFATEDLLPGQRLRDTILRAGDVFDKLLLVVSPNSMNSDWGKTEILRARQRERVDGIQVLFPIRLCPLEDLARWSAVDPVSGEDVAAVVRESLVADFAEWRDPSTFAEQLSRVITALRRADESRREWDAAYPSLLPAVARGQLVTEEMFSHVYDSIMFLETALSLPSSSLRRSRKGEIVTAEHMNEILNAISRIRQARGLRTLWRNWPAVHGQLVTAEAFNELLAALNQALKMDKRGAPSST